MPPPPKRNFVPVVIAFAVIGLAVWVVFSRGAAPVPPAFDPAITLVSAQERSVQTGRPVLALFTADWCGACQTLKRGALANARVTDWLGEQVQTVYIDTDANPAISQQHNISAIPALLVLRDGREVARLEGAVPADTLLTWLETHASAPAGLPVASSPAATPGG